MWTWQPWLTSILFFCSYYGSQCLFFPTFLKISSWWSINWSFKTTRKSKWWRNILFLGCTVPLNQNQWKSVQLLITRRVNKRMSEADLMRALFDFTGQIFWFMYFNNIMLSTLLNWIRIRIKGCSRKGIKITLKFTHLQVILRVYD